EVRSAGTEPASQVNSKAVEAMKEAGIDITDHTPTLVDQYLDDQWDYVITVCDHANETCPAFLGQVRHRLHMGFEDPAATSGTDEEILNQFRKVRKQIEQEFKRLYELRIKQKDN
ncbi:MAG: arsenate reductase ArsC, partial [Bacteroidota bacterium]